MNNIEFYKEFINMCSEVDSRPKNIQPLDEEAHIFTSMYDVPLSAKQQHEALVACLYEQDVLRQEDREVV